VRTSHISSPYSLQVCHRASEALSPLCSGNGATEEYLAWTVPFYRLSNYLEKSSGKRKVLHVDGQYYICFSTSEQSLVNIDI
ncbi:hypothetical protein KIN20_024728, partial [Parelaphostrongylus tenuis]